MSTLDAIVIGAGIGGLCVAAILAQRGWSVLVCESHAIAGGAAHSFVREGFHFDSGPSFHCGLADPGSLNPLRLILDRLGQHLETVTYSPFAHYHFPGNRFTVYGSLDRYCAEIARVSPAGASQYRRFVARLLPIYDALRQVPLFELRADPGMLLTLCTRYPRAALQLAGLFGVLQSSAGEILDRDVRDPFVRRLVDLECFLLSGLPAHGTVAPEVAFMLGERDRTPIDYPRGGSGAIVDALVRALEDQGGRLRLGAHVERILVEGGRARGVRLRSGELLRSSTVISNASLWDTVRLLGDDAPPLLRQQATAMPAVDSFMHLHLGIRADGLDGLDGHHVVVGAGDLSEPGMTCMISIPTCWDPGLAPPGHHAVHVYSLEPFAPWQMHGSSPERKQVRARPLFAALKRIIPDLDARLVFSLIGTPLTHARFLRRHRGSYGPACLPRPGRFPGPQTPLPGLVRVGDTTLPGIGVPAVAASAILCANWLGELHP